MVAACEHKAYSILHASVKYNKKAICHAKPDEVGARIRSQISLQEWSESSDAGRERRGVRMSVQTRTRRKPNIHKTSKTKRYNKVSEIKKAESQFNRLSHQNI